MRLGNEERHDGAETDFLCSDTPGASVAVALWLEVAFQKWLVGQRWLLAGIFHDLRDSEAVRELFLHLVRESRGRQS